MLIPLIECVTQVLPYFGPSVFSEAGKRKFEPGGDYCVCAKFLPCWYYLEASQNKQVLYKLRVCPV